LEGILIYDPLIGKRLEDRFMFLAFTFLGFSLLTCGRPAIPILGETGVVTVLPVGRLAMAWERCWSAKRLPT
jgi:hypothetical protein